jgi:hypothetical protein
MLRAKSGHLKRAGDGAYTYVAPGDGLGARTCYAQNALVASCNADTLEKPRAAAAVSRPPKFGTLKLGSSNLTER